MLHENLRRLEVTIMKEYSGPVVSRVVLVSIDAAEPFLGTRPGTY